MTFPLLSQYDPLGTAAGLFSQIAQGDEQTRVKCLQYVNNKFVKAGSEVFNKEVEELIVKEVKKLLQVRKIEVFIRPKSFFNCKILHRTCQPTNSNNACRFSATLNWAKPSPATKSS